MQILGRLSVTSLRKWFNDKTQSGRVITLRIALENGQSCGFHLSVFYCYRVKFRVRTVSNIKNILFANK